MVDRLVQTRLLSAIFLATFTVSVHSNVSSISAAMNYHTGGENDALSGATSFALILGSELGNSPLKASFNLAGVFASNIIEIADTQYNVQRFGGELLAGAKARLAPGAVFQPVVGVHGILGSEVFRSTTPPSGESENSMRLTLGYEALVGMAIPVGSTKIELSGAWRSIQTTYADVDVSLNSLSFRAGILF